MEKVLAYDSFLQDTKNIFKSKPELLFLKNGLRKLEEFLKNFSENLSDILSNSVKSTLNAGGKRIRPSLLLISAKNENYNLDYLIPAAAAIEMIHTASLIHDDIIDKSELRRGKKTLHKIYDRDTAKFVGDYLLTQTFYLLSNYEIPEILLETSKAASLLVKGEFNQLKTKKKLNQNENDYIEKIYEKTSSLFKLSCLIGGILSKSNNEDIEKLIKFGELIGISFQINDDLLDINLRNSSKNIGKPIGNDLKQGDITLPFIYGNENPDFKKQFKNFIAKNNFTSEEFKKLLSLLDVTGAVKRTEEKLYFYLDQAKKIAYSISGNQRRKALLAICDLIAVTYKAIDKSNS